MKTTATDRLIQIFSEKKERSNIELNSLVGWAFSQKVSYLKSLWYTFEKKGKKEWDKNYVSYYIMTGTPDIQTKLNINKVSKADPKQKFLGTTNIPNINYKKRSILNLWGLLN